MLMLIKISLDMTEPWINDAEADVSEERANDVKPQPC